MRCRSMGKQDGFTLIEVLVVVAIIALLVSILLPSLNRARSLSKANVCLGHMRQLGIGALQYCNEFRGYVPPVDPSQKDVGPQDTTSGAWGTYSVGSDDMRVYYCSGEHVHRKWAADLALWRCPGAGNIVLVKEDLQTTYSVKGGTRRGSAYEYDPWMYNIVLQPAGSWPTTLMSSKPQIRPLRADTTKFTSKVMLAQDNDDSGKNWYPDADDPHAVLDGGNMFYMDGHASWVRAKDWEKETDGGRIFVRR